MLDVMPTITRLCTVINGQVFRRGGELKWESCIYYDALLHANPHMCRDSMAVIRLLFQITAKEQVAADLSAGWRGVLRSLD
jgi:hypothetical protein